MRFSPGLMLGLLASPAAAQQSPDRPVMTQTGDQTEPAIAVNPTNPAHLVVAAIEVSSASQCRVSASFDGGATWQSSLVPTGIRQRCTDPSLAFNQAGRLYFGGLFFDGNYTVTNIGIAVSTDGGLTFAAPVMAPGSASSDKPYIAVDRSGTASDGRVYVAWNTTQTAPCTGPDASGFYQNCPNRRIMIAWSNNNGATFAGSWQLTASGSNNFGAHPAVGPAGEVYVAWRQFHRQVVGGWLGDDAVFVAYSANGIASYSTYRVATLGAQHAAAAVQGTWRTTRYPVVAVSPGGATRGNAYITFADDPDEVETVAPAVGGTEVFLRDRSRAGLSVGYERTGTDQFTGVLHHRADLRPIVVPGATMTMPRGINARNQIVGTYRSGNPAPFRGFVLDGNGFSSTAGQLPFDPLDVPAAAATSPSGINASGVIVGTFENPAGTYHGFVYDGSFQTLDAPGALGTLAHDINDRGVVVGEFQDAAGTHGFVYDGGVFTTLDYPGATETRALGIDAAGTIVGAYRDGANVAWAFRRDGTTFSQIAIANAITSTASAIDDGGVVTGFYSTASTGPRGFVLRRPVGQDVWLTRSGDAGATWAPASRVNDVQMGDQFAPWMCVDARGLIHAAWLDRRDDAANFAFRAYYATSVDGGLTFQPNRMLAAAGSDPRNAAQRNSSGAGFVGDYIGLGCGDGVAHAAWPDLRAAGTSGQDIHEASVTCAGLTDHGDGTITDGCTRLMWLKQADLAATQAVDADHDGQYTFAEARAWADALVVAGYSDWRLHAARFPDFNCRPGATPMIGIYCAGAEAMNLRYMRGVSVAAPAPFTGVVYGYYWTGTRFNPTRMFATSMVYGEMGSANATPGVEINAWAVRDALPSDAPAGSNVRAQPHPDVSVEFAAVSAGGTTAVTVSTTDPGLSTSSFELLGTYYDLTTTATATGSITVCIHYDEADLGGADESSLQLAHEEAGAFVPVASTVDVVANIVCGTVTSLSWFALGSATGWPVWLYAIIALVVALLLWVIRAGLSRRPVVP